MKAKTISTDGAEKVDAYTWWRAALQGNFGPVHDGDPQPGFYRKRKGKDGPWEPVAIWKQEGGTLIKIGEIVFHEDTANEAWTWVCKHPVTHEAYQKAVKGEGWADGIPEPPAPGIGDNRPPSGAEELLALIEEAERDALKEIDGGIKDQAQADRAANWRDRLLKYYKEAEAGRKEEKRPFDEGARAIQVRWKPVVDRAVSAGKQVKAALTTFLNEQERKRLAEERAAREKAEREAAEAAEKGEEPALAEPIQDAPKAKAGTGARATALRTVRRADITDYQKVLAHFAEHSDVKAVVEKLANAAARSGVPVPGVEIIESKEAA